jgi:hypothetical protein
VLSVLLSFGHCVVCPSVFWSLCCLFFCLLVIVLSVPLSFDHCVVCSSVFWPLCCLFFFDLQILITPLVSSNSFYNHQLLGLKNTGQNWTKQDFYLWLFIVSKNNELLIKLKWSCRESSIKRDYSQLLMSIAQTLVYI